MPIVEMDPETWVKKRSRILIAGEPNSRKTSSLLTWPRPIAILSYPGEKGAASILPDPANGVHVWTYSVDPNKPESSSEVVKNIRDLTVKIVTGQAKQGIKFESFAGDGIHKYAEYILDAATGGNYFSGEEFDAKLYMEQRRVLLKYIDMVANSSIANVVFTCWTALEKDNPQERGSNPSRHLWPDLPGQLAKKILGEFTATLYALVRSPMPGKPVEGVWQLQPDSEVWGVGVKAPSSIATKLPKYASQDWKVLMDLLDAAKAQQK